MARGERRRARAGAAPCGGAILSALRDRIASLTGVAPDAPTRLTGGDLSEILLVERPGGLPPAVAKGGPNAAVEAQMLRTLAEAGMPVPAIEGEYGDVLLLAHVPNDEAFTPRVWADIGMRIRALHDRRAELYGWPSDYALGSVLIDNRQRRDWPGFWAEQRLLAASATLDLPWRERVERLARRMGDLLPTAPPPALLHGDLWTGNILVQGGGLAALIDPACYHGDAEVDLAMLCLFGAPDTAFWDAYGPLADGWESRRPVYQLFPALVHLRLFGASYGTLVDRLLSAAGA